MVRLVRRAALILSSNHMSITSLFKTGFLAASPFAFMAVAVGAFVIPYFAEASTYVPVTTVANLTNAPDAPNSSISANLSQNWSGYVADTGTYTNVTGTWTVPTVPASNSAEADATWVGIGGVSGTDLIQAGTQTITENGQIEYQAWYETLPNASTPVSLTVSPGDSITTTLTNQGGNNWLVTIKDNTTNQQYVQTVTYASSESSAEWIEEMPSDGQSFIPLDNFGSVAFSNASATVNGAYTTIAGAGAHAVAMSNGQSILSQPSAVGSDTASFTVTRSSASSDVSPTTIQVRRNFSRGGRGFERQGTTGQNGQIGTGLGSQSSQSITQIQVGQGSAAQAESIAQLQQQIANAFGGQFGNQFSAQFGSQFPQGMWRQFVGSSSGPDSASSSSSNASNVTSTGTTYTYSLGNGTGFVVNVSF
jgi:hypothetical protein